MPEETTNPTPEQPDVSPPPIQTPMERWAAPIVPEHTPTTIRLDDPVAAVLRARLATDPDPAATVELLRKWDDDKRGRGPGQILELLPRIAGEIGAVGKDGRNEHFKFNYKSADAIYDACTEVIAEHGVTVTQRVRKLEVRATKTSGGKDTFHVTLELWIRFEAPDGSWREIVSLGEAIKSDDKARAGAISLAKKYGMIHMFGIRTNEPDPDGEADPRDEPQGQQRQERPPQEQRRQSPPASASNSPQRDVRKLEEEGIAAMQALGNLKTLDELEVWEASHWAAIGGSDKAILMPAYTMTRELLAAADREYLLLLKSKWGQLVRWEQELLYELKKLRWEETAPPCAHIQIIESEDGTVCVDCSAERDPDGNWSDGGGTDAS